MTCITSFYLGGAIGYDELLARLPHLHNAKSHLAAYQQEQAKPNADSSSGFGLNMASHDVRKYETHSDLTLTFTCFRYISSISTQEEVTKFLNRYLDNFNQLGEIRLEEDNGSTATTQQPLPTVFGGNVVKSKLAVVVSVLAC